MNKNIKYILIIGTAFIIWKISRFVCFYQITVHKDFFFAQIIKHFTAGSIIGLVPLVVGLKKNKKEYGTIGFFIALFLGMTWINLFISIFLIILILFQTTNAKIALTRNIFFTITIISALILFGLYISDALGEMSPLGFFFLCNLILAPLSLLMGILFLIIEKKNRLLLSLFTASFVTILHIGWRKIGVLVSGDRYSDLPSWNELYKFLPDFIFLFAIVFAVIFMWLRKKKNFS